MRKVLLSLTFCIAAATAWSTEVGDKFESGGIRYEVTKLQPPTVEIRSPATAGSPDWTYTGDITLVPTVVNPGDGVTYEVSFLGSQGIYGSSITSITLAGDFAAVENHPVELDLHCPTLSCITLPETMSVDSHLEVYTVCPVIDCGYLEDSRNYIFTLRHHRVLNADGSEARPYVTTYENRYDPESVSDRIYPDAEDRIIIPKDMVSPNRYSLLWLSGYRYICIPLFYDTQGSPVEIDLLVDTYSPDMRTEVGDLAYVVTMPGATVMGFSEKAADRTKVNIPPTIEYDGRTVEVVAVAESAFRYSAVRDLDLGQVKYINNEAFLGADLKKVSIPGSVESIGDYTFGNAGLERVDFATSPLYLSDYGLPPFVSGQLCYITDRKVEDGKLTFRLVNNFYNEYGQRFRELGLRSLCDGELFEPDENGVYTVGKKILGDLYDKVEVISNSNGVYGSLCSLDIGENKLGDEELDHIYIIGTVTGWNRPNDPASGYSSDNAWMSPDVFHATFYEDYKMNLVEPGTGMYAGHFYLPATEVAVPGQQGMDYASTFRFIKSLTGWGSPDMLGSMEDDFYNVIIDINDDRRLTPGGNGNWGVQVAETTPVTVVVWVDDNFPEMSIRQGFYEVAAGSGNYPLFITKEAGIESVEAEAVNAAAPVEWYNLQGVRVAEPSHGVYIRRRGTVVDKVLVR